MIKNNQGIKKVRSNAKIFITIAALYVAATFMGYFTGAALADADNINKAINHNKEVWSDAKAVIELANSVKTMATSVQSNAKKANDELRGLVQGK